MNSEDQAFFAAHPELYEDYLKEQQPEEYQRYLQETGQAIPAQAAPEPDNSYVPGVSEMGQVARIPLKAGGHLLGLAGAGVSALEDIGNSITGTEGAKTLASPKEMLTGIDDILGSPKTERGRMLESAAEAMVPIGVLGKADLAKNAITGLLGWGGSEVAGKVLPEQFKAEHPILSGGAQLAAGLLASLAGHLPASALAKNSAKDTKIVHSMLGRDGTGAVIGDSAEGMPIGVSDDTLMRAAEEQRRLKVDGYDVSIAQILKANHPDSGRVLSELMGNDEAGVGLRSDIIRQHEQLAGDTNSLAAELNGGLSKQDTANELSSAIHDWPQKLKQDSMVPPAVTAWKAMDPETPLHEYLNLLDDAVGRFPAGREIRTEDALNSISALKWIKSDIMEQVKRDFLAGNHKLEGLTIRTKPAMEKVLNALDNPYSDQLRNTNAKADAQVGQIRQTYKKGMEDLHPEYADHNTAYGKYMDEVVNPALQDISNLTPAIANSESRNAAANGITGLIKQGIGLNETGPSRVETVLRQAATKNADIPEHVTSNYIDGVVNGLMELMDMKRTNPSDFLSKNLGHAIANDAEDTLKTTDIGRMVNMLMGLVDEQSPGRNLKRGMEDLQGKISVVSHAPSIERPVQRDPNMMEGAGAAVGALFGGAPFWASRKAGLLAGLMGDQRSAKRVAEMIREPENVEIIKRLANRDIHENIYDTIKSGLLGGLMAEHY
jgi:hypothetical protein